MLKIVLKEPVGGFVNQNGVSARSLQYVWSLGFLTSEFMQKYDSAKTAKGALFFVDAIAALAGQTLTIDGQKRQMGFLIDLDNIAWIQEYPDSVRNTEPDFEKVK